MSAGGDGHGAAKKAGREAVQAFLDPEDIDALYRIADRDGTSLSAEIRKAVKRYLRGGAA